GDGLSNIVTLPSDIVNVGVYPTGSGRNKPQISLPAMGASNFLAWTQVCADGILADRGKHTSFLGGNWACGIMCETFGNCLLAPNPKVPNCLTNLNSNGDAGFAAPGMATLSSFHPGGGNVLLVDGSVRFLKDSTNLMAIWSLGSRNQGEVLSAD